VIIFQNSCSPIRDCLSPVECHMKRSGFGSIRGANAPPMRRLIRGGAIWPILSGEVPIIDQKADTG
jgi:hypothetical protein